MPDAATISVSELPAGLQGRSNPDFASAQKHPEDMIAWIQPLDIPLDAGGPVDRPFEPMGDAFASTSAYEHFARTAVKYADRPAIIARDITLTFAEAYRIVQAMSGAISACVPAGRPVGLLAGNTAWYPLSLLAAMAAGCPAVSLNPRDPPERTLQIARVARLHVLVGVGESKFATINEITWIDAASDSFAAVASVDTFVPRASSVDAPAIVLYTSGSTGEPKGIVNSQRALLRRVQQHVDGCHINSSDVLMPLCGAATIAGCRELLTALLAGATLCVADVEQMGLREVRRAFRARGVTIVYSAPTLMRALLAAPGHEDFETLRIIRLGGEKILWSDIAALRQKIPDRCFVQIGYSATETTGAQWFVAPQGRASGVVAPVGYILPGISYAIIGDDGVSAPPGETGELVLKSPYVLLGYWEEGKVTPLNADAREPNSRCYFTGDLAKIDANSVLTIVGRKGRQIKINGRRVEPAELESAIREIENVDDAVVHVTGDNELVAFVVSRATQANMSSRIRSRIRQTLPQILNPARIHVLAEIPRLPGGKLDMAKLAAHDRASKEASQPAARTRKADEDDAQQAIAVAWSNILGSPDRGRAWDEAGGDSLKLMRCVLDIESALRIELPLEAFTTGMTANDMMLAVERACEGRRSASNGELKTPIVFLLPGSVGHGPSLSAFCAAISTVARVIPVRYPDLDAILRGCNSIADLSEIAMQQIAHDQPDGDVRLLGYSLGGAVAFETALRLAAAGRTPKFVGIIDTNIGAAKLARGATITRTLRRIRLRRISVGRVACRTIAVLAARAGKERALARALESPGWRAAPGIQFTMRLELEEILRMRAMAAWRAAPRSPLTAKGTLFRCNRAGLTPSLGWDGLFDELAIVPVSGGHLDLVIEPHLSSNRPLMEAAIAESVA